MILIDEGTSYKYGVYLSDKSDATTILAFEIFHAKAETVAGRKLCWLWTDCAFESAAWEKYCQSHGITHEFTAPYSSAQNGLAECAIRTTMDDVHTLLCDSNLGPLTGLKWQLTLLICTISFPLANILVLSLWKHSQGKDKMSHTFKCLALNAGPKYLLPMETRSSILRVLSVVCLVMPWEAGTTKSKMLSSNNYAWLLSSNIYAR